MRALLFFQLIMAMHRNDAIPSLIGAHVGASGHPRPRCRRAGPARALQALWHPVSPTAVNGNGTASPLAGTARAPRPHPARPRPPRPRPRSGGLQTVPPLPGVATRAGGGRSWRGDEGLPGTDRAPLPRPGRLGPTPPRPRSGGRGPPRPGGKVATTGERARFLAPASAFLRRFLAPLSCVCAATLPRACRGKAAWCPRTQHAPGRRSCSRG